MQNSNVSHQVRELVTNNLNLPGVKIYLLGSWARNQERPPYDIDVGICYEHEALCPGIF